MSWENAAAEVAVAGLGVELVTAGLRNSQQQTGTSQAQTQDNSNNIASTVAPVLVGVALIDAAGSPSQVTPGMGGGQDIGLV